ncbi:MAG TPA: orotidine-5'-phosphate decarboxylase, partial [Nitrosospira sp.]
MSDPRIIVALDFSTAEQAISFAAKLDPNACRVKVGKELFTAAGPQLVEKMMSRGFDVFLDLKFHDIPNTVANACKAAAGLGVWMMNVHALGGRRMLSAAREAVPPGSAKLIAVTLLTSMEHSDLKDIGLNGEPQDVVRRLAVLAHDCGLDGVVSSAL